MDAVRAVGWVYALSTFLVLGCSSEDVGDDECENSRTQFAGDCLALPVPHPNDGIQIHYGPKTYTEADMAPFIVPPCSENPSGCETVDVQYQISTNDRTMLFNRYQGRLRPGAHHMIVAHTDNTGDYEGLDTASELPPLQYNTLFGAQSGSVDVPMPGLPIAEEDRGLAFTMGPRRQLALNAHFVNTTNEPLLREGWFNIYYADPETITTIAAPMFLIGGILMQVLPGATEVLKYRTVVPHDMRIVWAFGHFHSHTLRMTAYKRDPVTNETTLLYETYDYREPLYVGYNTIIETPLPDRDNLRSGAFSGMLTLKKDDIIEWECEVENETNDVIRYGNKLIGAEMCGFFGFYAPANDGQHWRPNPLLVEITGS